MSRIILTISLLLTLFAANGQELAGKFIVTSFTDQSGTDVQITGIFRNTVFSDGRYTADSIQVGDIIIDCDCRKFVISSVDTVISNIATVTATAGTVTVSDFKPCTADIFRPSANYSFYTPVMGFKPCTFLEMMVQIDSTINTITTGSSTDDQTASEVNITDSGGFYSGFTVEAALQEVGDSLSQHRTDIDAAGGGGTDTSGYNISLGLSGTTLTLTDGNGDVTEDLAGLQDGTGTDDQTASEVSVTDSGANYAGSDVEAVLSEIADTTGALRTDIFSGAWSDLSGVPAGFADDTDDEGTDDQTASEVSVTDSGANYAGGNVETVLAEIADTTSALRSDIFSGAWSDLSGVPAGFADNTDDEGTDDQTAAEVSITDGNSYYTATDVDGAFDETSDTLATLRTDLDAIAGGASDGVATAGTLDTANEEIDVTVNAPGSNFSIDVSSIENLGSFSGWDTSSADDFDGAWSSLTGVPAGFADDTDDEGTDDQTASEVDITDAGGYYTGTTTEAALQEVGDSIAQHRIDIDALDVTPDTVTLLGYGNSYLFNADDTTDVTGAYEVLNNRYTYNYRANAIEVVVEDTTITSGDLNSPPQLINTADGQGIDRLPRNIHWPGGITKGFAKSNKDNVTFELVAGKGGKALDSLVYHYYRDSLEQYITDAQAASGAFYHFDFVTLGVGPSEEIANYETDLLVFRDWLIDTMEVADHSTTFVIQTCPDIANTDEANKAVRKLVGKYSWLKVLNGFHLFGTTDGTHPSSATIDFMARAAYGTVTGSIEQTPFAGLDVSTANGDTIWLATGSGADDLFIDDWHFDISDTPADNQVLKYDSGTGKISFEADDSGGGTLTIEEADGTPSVGSVSTLQFDQADGFSVTDEGSGQAQIDLSNIPTSALADDPIIETELDTEAELETQLTDVSNVIVSTEIDAETELEGLLSDVTDVFTNNDGALSDDDLTDDDLTALQNVTITTPSDSSLIFWDNANSIWIDGVTIGELRDNTDNQTASEVDVTDSGANYAGSDVEAVLAEIADTTGALRTDIFSGSWGDLTGVPAGFADDTDDEGTDDQTASEVSTTDAGGYYAGTDVEAALSEIADTLTQHRTDIDNAGSGSGGSGTTEYYFAAKDTSTTAISADTWTSITWDTEIIENASFTHAANSADITLDSTGVYKIEIQYRITTDNASSRNDVWGKVQKDTGGGYSDLDGSWAKAPVMFQTNTNLQFENLGFTTVYTDSFTAGDDIRVQVYMDVVSTYAFAESNITITRIE